MIVCVAAVISACGTSNASVDAPRVVEAPSGAALETISADASGDQPSGRRPASDCAPVDVSETEAPLVMAPAGIVSSARRVPALVPPWTSESAPLPALFVSPRRVRRMSIGMTPAPAGTMIWRQTVVYPFADARIVCAPSGNAVA